MTMNGDLDMFIKKHFDIPFMYMYEEDEFTGTIGDDIYDHATHLFKNDYYKWLPYFKNAIKTFYEQYPNLLEEFNMDDLMRAKTLTHEHIKVFNARGMSWYYLDRLIHEKYLMIVINLKKSCSVDGDYVLK
jgi:hypothetical protein